jgi:hypothetical protein
MSLQRDCSEFEITLKFGIIMCFDVSLEGVLCELDT